MVWPWYGMEWFRWWMISMVWWWILPAVGPGMVWRWMVCWTSIADRSYLLLAQVRRASERLKVDLWHRSLFFLTFFSSSDIQTCPCICVLVFIWCVFVKLCTSIYERQMYQKYPTCWSADRSSLAAQGLFCKKKNFLLFARFLSDFLAGLAYSCILTGPH